MKNIEIFDPAMCCSTGVCGPSIDPELMRVSTFISAMAKNGIVIKRHNLSSEPQEFLNNPIVSDLLKKEGADVLPITLVDGEVGKTKEYPSNAEFSKWLGVTFVGQLPKKARTSGCCGGSGCC